jgi:hypothetical protein
MIPITAEGYARVEALGKAVKYPDWTIKVAKNYVDALTEI